MLSSLSGSHQRVVTIKTRRWVPDSLILVTYVAMAVSHTYPLVRFMSTHAANADGDTGAYVWSLWWVREAFIRPGLSQFYSDWILHPVGTDLVMNAQIWFKAFLFLPLTASMGPVFTYNFSILFSLVASAFGMYLLGRRLVGQVGVAFYMGLAFGFCPFLLARSFGHLNFISAEGLPFMLLFLHQALDTGRLRPAVLSGLCLAVVGYSEYTYLLLAAIALAALLWILRPLVGWWRVIRVASVLGVTFVLAFLPLLVQILRRLSTPRAASAGGWWGADIYSADLLAFVTPPIWSTFLSAFSGPSRHFTGNAMEGTVYLGLGVIGLFGLGLFRLRRQPVVRAYVWVCLVFFLLSLGPLLHVGGVAVVEWDGLAFSQPLPFALLHWFQPLRDLRAPSRFAVMVALAAVVVAGYALAWLTQRRPKQASVLIAVACAAATLESASVPYPLSKLTSESALLDRIAGRPDGRAVLQLPFGIRSGLTQLGEGRTWGMYLQTRFARPYLGGFASRIEANRFEYFARLPVLSSLLRLQDGQEVPPGLVAFDRRLGLAFATRLGVGELLLSKKHIAATRLSPIQRYVEEVLAPENRIEDAEFVLYELAAAKVLDPRVAAEIDALIPVFGSPPPPDIEPRPWVESLRRLPSVVGPGEVLSGRFKIRNVTSQVWPPSFEPIPGAIALGYTWIRGGEKVDTTQGLEYRQYRTLLPVGLFPEEEVELPLPIRAPSVPGTYELSVTIVQEKREWFQCSKGACATFVVTVH